MNNKRIQNLLGGAEESSYAWYTLPMAVFVLAVCFGSSAVMAQEQEQEQEEGMEQVQASAGAPSPQVEHTKGRTWLLDGSVYEEYRFRYSGKPVGVDGGQSGQDHDIRLFFSSYLWDSTDHFAADLSLGAWGDLNGSSDDPALGDINDYSAPQSWHDNFDVYSLFGEYHGDGTLSLARVGRQTSDFGLPATFDGATLSLNAVEKYLELIAFGGRSVYFFELTDSLFEDWIASGVAVFRPINFLRLEADYRFTKEDTVVAGGTFVDGDPSVAEGVIDHSYGLSAHARLAHWAQVKAYARGLGKQFSHTGASVYLVTADNLMGLEAGGDFQLVTLREINELNDPYFAVLGESLPHVRAHLDAWKSFDTSKGLFGVHVGFDGRFLLKDDATQFNRDYGRAYLMVEGTDIFVPGPFFNVVGEYNFSLSETTNPAENMFSAGGSLGYQKAAFKGELGTYYYRYKYNYYSTVEELAQVRVYFGDLKYDVKQWFYLRLRYEYDQVDRDIHTVTFRLGQSF